MGTATAHETAVETVERRNTEEQVAVDANLDYESWNAKRITEWIIALDSDRLGKYAQTVLDSTTNEAMEGYCLEVTDANDLERLGIDNDIDQRFILSAIQTLIGDHR